MIASSDTLIPGQPTGGVRFGSTAPPSAAARDAVFVGLDNEQAPTMGGIYRARLVSNPALEPLVEIGGPVPGEPYGTVFNRIGEALSYDGRYVAFWGAWGDEVRPVTLICSDHGNAAVIAFCKQQHPNGLTVPVPVNQGIFVHDTQAQQTYTDVRTGTDYQDFLYWNFSGRPPGVGHAESEDFEEPRWRSTAFVATGTRRGTVQVAFKGRRALTPGPIDGIYLTQLPASPIVVRTVVETGMMGTLIDSMAPADVPVVSMGIERDGLRNGWLALSAAMGDEEDGWAGIYVTRTAR